MSGHFRQFRGSNSARQGLRDRTTRESVGEETWQKWVQEARADRAFRYFGIVFIAALGGIIFWITMQGW